MTSSPDARPDPLPPALSSMWRLCKLGYQHEPRLMLVAFVLALLSALPDALLALWLKLLGEGLLDHRPRLLYAAAIGLGASATATWFLRTVSTRVQRRFRDTVTIALESHVARLLASIATMLLAAGYAGGSFVGLALTIPQMVLAHGAVNAFGLVLCGLLAWTLELWDVML